MSAEEATKMETETSSSAPSVNKEEADLNLRIVYAKQTHKIAVSSSSTVEQLKQRIEAETGCPAGSMKLMYKGLLAAPGKPELSERKLSDCKITNNAKILVVGATAEQVLQLTQVQALEKTGVFKAEEAALSTTKQEKWCDMEVHKKIISKGPPDDAPFAYHPGADPLPMEPIGSLVNQRGQKVRLTFKVMESMLVISTKESTQQVPFSRIQNVKSQPITHLPQYHILCLQLGSTERSSYYFYWVPAQYVSAIKGAL